MSANDNDGPFFARPEVGTEQEYEDVAAILELNAASYPDLSANPVWHALIERFHAGMVEKLDHRAEWARERAEMADGAA